MRVAVLSDIQANYHALDAVLEEVTAEAPDELSRGAPPSGAKS